MLTVKGKLSLCDLNTCKWKLYEVAAYNTAACDEKENIDVHEVLFKNSNADCHLLNVSLLNVGNLKFISCD